MTDFKKRIALQCRRGMLEIDFMLERFLTNDLDSLSVEEQAAFERLLDEQDPVLYSWLLGYEHPESEEFKRLIGKIRRMPTES